MTRKDFVLIADVIAKIDVKRIANNVALMTDDDARKVIALAFADRLVTENKNFDVARFLAATENK